MRSYSFIIINILNYYYLHDNDEIGKKVRYNKNIR